MTDALRVAVGTLTRIPIRPPRLVDRPTAGRPMLLAPVTAVPPALVVLLLHVAVTWRLPANAGAVLAVALTAWWSRGLHLDGLADTADGLASGYNRDRALEVMRRGDVGPIGVATVVLVVLLQVTTLGVLLPTGPGTVLAMVTLLTSRQVLIWGCWRGVPAARHTGLGATVAGSVGDVAAATSSGVTLGLAAFISWAAGAGWYAGPLVVLAATLAAAAVLDTARRRLGGMTGDVLGAVVELSLGAALLVAVLLRG